jgi:hypothetical protein
MPLTVTAELVFRSGVEAVPEGPSPAHAIGVLFEDDGETGYFYALEPERAANPIVDAMQIYNAAAVMDSDRASRAEILWSSDGLKAGLRINGHVHAVFDFTAKRGFCRSNFPAPNSAWTSFDHRWSDEALDLLV